jgi:hypothetical protein
VENGIPRTALFGFRDQDAANLVSQIKVIENGAERASPSRDAEKSALEADLSDPDVPEGIEEALGVQ